MQYEGGISKRIPGLDGLRGVAAVIVLVTQMSGICCSFLNWMDFKGMGRSGVILFFVLSAFLLTYQVLNWDQKFVFSKQKWIKYALARVFRILPLFLVVLLMSLLSTHISKIPGLWQFSNYLRDIPIMMSVQSFFRHVVFLEGYAMLWTISVEFKFYFLLPPILLSLAYFFGNKFLHILMVLGLYIIFDYLFLSNTRNGTDTLPFLSVFMTGVFLAFLTKHTEERKLSKNSEYMFEIVAWVCVIFYILIIPAFFKKITGLVISEDLMKNNALFASLWALLIYSMLHGKGYLVRVLESKALVFLGAISYSLYLWHLLPIKLVHRFENFPMLNVLNGTQKSFIAFFLSILLAFISYKLIEKPFLKIGNKIRAKI